MKAIVHIDKKLVHNKELSFLSPDLMSLKICGKKVLSYYFELFNHLEVSEVYILGDTLDNKDIEEFYLSEVFPIDFNFVKNSEVEGFYKDNFELFKDDELLIIKNIGFIFDSFLQVKDVLNTQTKSFSIKDEAFELMYIKDHLKQRLLLEEKNFLDIKIINSLEDYIAVLNKILSKVEEVDYLNGYSNDKGIIIGKNVNIPKNCVLIPPLIILDNVNISNNCTLGPHSVVLKDVVIDSNTKIANSVVLDNTYIGVSLKLENKLIMSRKLIDKKSLEKFDIDEKFISKNKTFFN